MCVPFISHSLSHIHIRARILFSVGMWVCARAYVYLREPMPVRIYRLCVSLIVCMCKALHKFTCSQFDHGARKNNDMATHAYSSISKVFMKVHCNNMTGNSARCISSLIFSLQSPSFARLFFLTSAFRAL